MLTTNAFLRRIATHARGVPVQALVAVLVLTAGIPAAGAQGGGVLLTHPDASWSLRVDLPGFETKPARILRDRSQVWVQASNKSTGVSLTVYVEKMTKFRATSDCREYYQKKLAAVKKKTASSEYNDWAIAEDAPAEKGAAQAAPRFLHAWLYHDSFCVDVEQTREAYGQNEREVLVKTLDGLVPVPASREEMARSAAYMPLSSPAEQTALEAAQKMRAKDFATADALLQTLCSETQRQSPAGRTLPDCSLRNAGLSEARNINQGRDLATLYWRAGDLLAKDGRPDAAIEVFRKGLDIQPDHADIWFSMGLAERDRNDFVDASAALNKSLALRPNDARTMLWIATNLMDQGKLVEADAMLDRVQKADPREMQVSFRRAEILMQRGRYNEAIATFEKAKGPGIDEEKVRARIKECKDAITRENHPQ
jgi:tetratricopeptide (TPR) repeat protein